jgi:hypothetical protein
MKTYGVVDVEIHVFLTSAVVRSEWSASWPYRFNHGGTPPPPVSMDRKLRGPQSQSGRCEEEKILELIGLRSTTPQPSRQ